MKEINHFYSKIKFNIDVEKILEKAKKYYVEEFESSVAFNLDTLENNAKVNSKALIANSELVVGENSTFLKGKMSIGGTNQIEFKIWNNDGKAIKAQQMFETSKFIGFEGSVNLYQGKKSLVLNKTVPLDGEVSSVLNYLPRTTLKRNDLIEELVFYIEDMKDERFKELCYKYLDKFGKHFFDAPAALGHHHNYLGGLLKHTVGLMRVAQQLKNYDDVIRGALFLQNVISNTAINDVWDNYNDEKAEMKNDFKFTWSGSLDHYISNVRQLAGFVKKDTNIDWDVIMTAILFHDSGKILEYSYLGEDEEKYKLLYPKAVVSDFTRGSIDMDSAKGQGHIPLGAMILMSIINESDVVLKDIEIAKLNNCLFAHHGKFEWGTPSKAEYSEAVIVHIADFCDSRWEKDDKIK